VRFTLLPAFAAALACTREAPPARPKPRPPTIHVFSEPAPVAAVAASGSTVLTGSAQGLDRWDVAGGQRRRLGPAEGIPAGVRALALDRSGGVWFATDAGGGRLDLETERVDPLPPPPAPLAAVPAGIRALAPDGKGGVWIGARAGLFHAGEGGWQPTGLRREVTALHLAPDGTLWIGTRDGLVERNVGGVLTPAREGILLTSVTAIADGPDGALTVAGKDARGDDRIAVLLDGAFTTYRLSIDARVEAAAGARRVLLLVTSAGLLSLSLPEHGLVGLHRNGVQLLHVTGKRKRPPYAVGRVLDQGLPRDITSAAAAGDTLYLGTRALGTSRVVVTRAGAAISHLRPRELIAGARGLSVACASATDCYVATGGTATWRFDGRAFTPFRIDERPVIGLAFVRSPGGELLALYREPAERRLHVARLDGDTFVSRGELRVETPGGATLVSFARFAPDGLLWLGLSYVDGDGDERPYGVALVNLDLGAVSYHREADQKVGVMPVPNDVVDVAFHGDVAWFASGSGAARLRGEEVRVWTEADALKSEILHGVVVTAAGQVFVASASGVGVFDGERWSYPRPLALVAHAIALGKGGRVWLATERGLVAYEDGKTSRYDRRAGLLDDRVFDVAVDDAGRVWARGTDGLSLVLP
jgi:streptogramin lyase